MATQEIPIFPLNTVLYPAGRLPLRIFEARYVDMTKVCIRDNAVFGVCLIREGSEIGKPAQAMQAGCSARIAQWDVPHAGLFSLLVEGETVFRIQEQWIERDGLIRAHVVFEEPAEPVTLPDSYRALSRFLGELIEKLGAENFPSPLRLEDAAWVSHRMAEILPLPMSQKQRLLETRDPLDKLGDIERAIRNMDAQS